MGYKVNSICLQNSAFISQKCLYDTPSVVKFCLKIDLLTINELCKIVKYFVPLAHKFMTFETPHISDNWKRNRAPVYKLVIVIFSESLHFSNCKAQQCVSIIITTTLKFKIKRCARLNSRLKNLVKIYSIFLSCFHWIFWYFKSATLLNHVLYQNCLTQFRHRSLKPWTMNLFYYTYF